MIFLPIRLSLILVIFSNYGVSISINPPQPIIPKIDIDPGNILISLFPIRKLKVPTMVFIDICVGIIRTITSRAREIERASSTVSSEIYNNVQTISEERVNDSHESIHDSTMFIKSTFGDKLKQKSSGGNLLESEVQDAMNLSFHYLSMSDDNWEYLGEEDNIKVWKCKKPIGSKTNGSDKWPCIKATATIDVSPKTLMDLLMDSSRITLVNKFSAGRIDVYKVNELTKVVWNRSRIPYTFKPFDFCNLMHAYEDKATNKCILITKAIEHPLVPKNNEYVRSETILGLSILVPDKKNKNKTCVTSINHVRYSGLPPFIAARNSFQPTINYYKHLQEVAKSLK